MADTKTDAETSAPQLRRAAAAATTTGTRRNPTQPPPPLQNINNDELKDLYDYVNKDNDDALLTEDRIKQNGANIQRYINYINLKCKPLDNTIVFSNAPTGSDYTSGDAIYISHSGGLHVLNSGNGYTKIANFNMSNNNYEPIPILGGGKNNIVIGGKKNKKKRSSTSKNKKQNCRRRNTKKNINL